MTHARLKHFAKVPRQGRDAFRLKGGATVWPVRCRLDQDTGKHFSRERTGPLGEQARKVPFCSRRGPPREVAQLGWECAALSKTWSDWSETEVAQW